MTRPGDLSIDDIKRAANARMFDVLGALGVTDRPSSGGFISMCNPMRKDKNPSFTIWTKNGFLAWKDHTNDGPGGDRGDVIDLVSYLKGWWDLPNKGRPQAIRFLKDLLDLASVSREQLDSDRAASQKRQREIEKKSSEERERNEGRAAKLFFDAEGITGTAAEIYLRSRAIDLAKLPAGPRGGDRTPGVLRFIPQHDHSESGQRLPCMIAACVDYAVTPPRIRAVHRTWLKRDGSGKADVEPQRKVWPQFGGTVIPLWKGADNLGVKDLLASGICTTLVLTEGVEDGLSAALAAPELPVWAMISLGNLANVAKVLPPCFDAVILHRQNDWQTPQAVKSFERGKAALEATGRPVAEVAALGGKDLNDTLRGEE